MKRCTGLPYFRVMRVMILCVFAMCGGSVAKAQLNVPANNAAANNAAANNAAANNAALKNGAAGNSAPKNSAAVNSAVNKNNAKNAPKNNAANAVTGSNNDPLGNDLENGSNSASKNTLNSLNGNKSSNQTSNTGSLNSGSNTTGNFGSPVSPANTAKFNATVNAAVINTSALPIVNAASQASPPPVNAAAPGALNRSSMATTAPGPAAAHDPERMSYEDKVGDEVRRRLLNDLNRYCLDYCNILSVQSNVEEAFDTASADMGFESVASESQTARKFRTRSVGAEVLIDARFGTVNIDRLQALFAKLSERYPYPTELRWSRITFPDTGLSTKNEAQVRGDFASQVKGQLERIVSEYCPRECKIHTVEVNVARATMDEVQDGQVGRFLFARDGKGALFVRGVKVALSLDSSMDAARRGRIQTLFREHLLPFGNVSLQVSGIAFPRSAEEVQKDLDDTRGDPYGIERLGRLLKVFKEYSSTKEIIRERDTSVQTSQSSESTKNETEREKAEKSVSASNSSNMTSQEREREAIQEKSKSTESQSSLTSQANGTTFWTTNTMLIVGGIVLALLIAGAIGLRFVVTGKRMQAVIHEGMQGQDNMSGMGSQASPMGLQNPIMVGIPGGRDGAGYSGGAGGYANDEHRQRMHMQNLRDELIQTFITQPKVARDVFGRILREDGIEYAAKCVVIFGELMIFELLGDADLKQDITTLAEYVHINAPEVTDEAQLEILRNLKLKMTAGKMRQMTNKSLDIFDFLKAKSPRQIYELIGDESGKSQSIVLTQLNTEKRRAVFELFEGQAKVELLKELCNGDTVAKEYLYNVAEAFKRKAQTKASFTGENVHGTDVLLDLLERAEIHEQRNLMEDLDRTNPDSARVVRSRLVSVETLPYLRDGLLLEIFLSMEGNTMATFLAGTRDHIRSLVLSKAPPDVAQDWMEMLESIRSTDPEALRLAEMQVITKIRSFCSSGLISLLEINESLYPRTEMDVSEEDAGQSKATRVFKISNPLVA